MTRESPSGIGDDLHVVLRFTPRRRPRGSRREPPRDVGSSPLDPEVCDSIVPSLAAYERRDEDDDFRHRMTMNCMAFAVDLALIVIGVWLADHIAGR